MQLASHGARAAARNVSNLNILSHPPGAVRAYHTPPFLQPKASPLPQGAARKILTETRVILGRFFAQLTAPGIGTVPSVSRSAYGGPTSIPSIQSRMSFPVRTKLSRAMESRYFPKVPVAPRPCSVTNVGLGTARNFSSGRTVFQSFAENVPIATRAFYEVDWDIKASKERENFKQSLRAKRKASYGNERLRPRKEVLRAVSEQSSPEVEIDRYFTSPVSEVTTYLLVPLAPNLSHAPLPADPGGHEPLLPLRDLAFIHDSYDMHSLRVWSLFSRLDASNVWERGVLCSAYAHRAGPEGLCAILKVEFVGWTKEEVRSVIGESGSGWCVLEETTSAAQPEHDAFSDTSSVLSDISGDILSNSEYSVSSDAVTQSLILPTLDFSSSFLDPSRTSASLDHPSSTIELKSDSETWSDADTSESWIEDNNEWFGFSSDFVSRTQR